MSYFFATKVGMFWIYVCTSVNRKGGQIRQFLDLEVNISMTKADVGVIRISWKPYVERYRVWLQSLYK